MNTQNSLAIVAAAALVLIVGYCLVHSTKQVSKINSINNASSLVGPATDRMTISEHMKQGGSYQCAWTESANGNSIAATIYIDGATLREEQNSKTQSMNITTDYLVKDGYLYSWSSALQNRGTKTKLLDNAGVSLKPNAPSSTLDLLLTSLDAYAQLPGYTCKPWVIDAAQLTPPSRITFIGS